MISKATATNKLRNILKGKSLINVEDKNSVTKNSSRESIHIPHKYFTSILEAYSENDSKITPESSRIDTKRYKILF